jgi:hypothetical protein
VFDDPQSISGLGCAATSHPSKLPHLSQLTSAASHSDNPGMNDQPSKPGGGASIVLVAALVLALPALYVLSTGPIIWLDSKFHFGQETAMVLRVIYMPLVWAVENEVPIIGPALAFYFELWD